MKRIPPLISTLTDGRLSRPNSKTRFLILQYVHAFHIWVSSWDSTDCSKDHGFWSRFLQHTLAVVCITPLCCWAISYCLWRTASMSKDDQCQCYICVLSWHTLFVSLSETLFPDITVSTVIWQRWKSPLVELSGSRNLTAYQSSVRFITKIFSMIYSGEYNDILTAFLSYLSMLPCNKTKRLIRINRCLWNRVCLIKFNAPSFMFHNDHTTNELMKQLFKL